jgi:CTP synthase (UTP-ammonia lyase)
MPHMTTAAKLARLTRDWSRIAGDNIVIEEIGGTYYGFRFGIGDVETFPQIRTGNQYQSRIQRKFEQALFFAYPSLLT